MPRFSTDERDRIREDLLIKGERLFVQHGLKKVTVDDLTKETAIAKGSFYAFFDSKEHLYVEILYRIGNEMLERTDTFLTKNKSLPPRVLVKKLIAWSFDEMEKNPLLMQQSLEIRTHLLRKLSKEFLERYPDIDVESVKVLTAHGIKFSCEDEIVGQVFQMLSVAYDGMHDYAPAKKKIVIDILISGTINEIVEE